MEQATELPTGENLAEAIYQKHGHPGVNFAIFASTLELLRRAEKTSAIDSGMRGDVIEELYKLVQHTAIEQFFFRLASDCKDNQDLRSAVEQNPMMAIVTWGQMTEKKKHESADKLINLTDMVCKLLKESGVK